MLSLIRRSACYVAIAAVGVAASIPGLNVSAQTAGSPPVSISTVHGAFYFNPANSGGLDLNFLPPKATIPVFAQDFPVIDFNPPSGAQVGCSNATGVDENTRPFTDVVPNPNGTCSLLVAQGSGQQAGLGSAPAGMFTFQAIFTANLTVGAAGQVTFNLFSDDGWMLGAGKRVGGTDQPTFVSGSKLNPLSSTPADGFPVVGSFNVPSAPAQNQVTVAFPSAGTYPIELDYTECCGGQLALVLGTTFGNPILPSPLIKITGVTVSNGSVDATWEVVGTPSTPITSYVVTATPPTFTFNGTVLRSDTNRMPAPNAGPVSSAPIPAPATHGSVSGLIEDCHETYSISVTPMMGNVAAAPAIWESPVRPSGIVRAAPADPPYVVILLDGIFESKLGFEFNPYNPTSDGIPSYCPEAFVPAGDVLGAPSWPNAHFYTAPSGPAQIFDKWNFYDPLDTNGFPPNDPKQNSNSTPRALDAQGRETNEFMLDAIAARGAVILPFSYMGASLKAPTDFKFNAYTVCNSTPAAPGPCNDLNTRDGTQHRTIQQDVSALACEIKSVHHIWTTSRIIVMGHSQGGLIAFEWWIAHSTGNANDNCTNNDTGNNNDSGLDGVTNLFSLDSPINGIGDEALTYPGYPRFSGHAITDRVWLALDKKFGYPFRFIGTWGDSPAISILVFTIAHAYGDPQTDTPLQVQLLVRGSRCNNKGTIDDCPSPPDNISSSLPNAPYPRNIDCSITDSSPDWVKKTSHFIVKFCPQNVAYFNGILSLDY